MNFDSRNSGLLAWLFTGVIESIAVCVTRGKGTQEFSVIGSVRINYSESQNFEKLSLSVPIRESNLLLG
jgi:hypothetical protein